MHASSQPQATCPRSRSPRARHPSRLDPGRARRRSRIVAALLRFLFAPVDGSGVAALEFRDTTGDCKPTLCLSETEVLDAIRAAQGGDARAFARLHDHHLPRMQRLARRRTATAQDAEECVQEAMLRAWQSLTRFEGGADDFAGWLARIVVNVCIDRARYDHRRPETAPLEVPVDGDVRQLWLADREPDPETQLERTLAREAIDGAIDGIAEPFRAVFALDRLGRSYAEIAEALGVPLGTVRSRLNRARRRVRALLLDGGTLTTAQGAGTCWSVPLRQDKRAILTLTIEMPRWGRRGPRLWRWIRR